MLSVRVDLGNLVTAPERFEASYQRAVGDMKALLDEKAAEERSGHAYQNRTGDLEASTYASEVITTGDADEVQFGARTEYAEYVNARGFMRIDELAAEAESEIGYLFAGLAAEI